MIWLYRIIFLPALLLAFPYYLRRMIRRGGYRDDFHHRFGIIDRAPPRRRNVPRIWIQAVSVGEVNAVGPLVDALHERGAEIVVTTTTSTGYALLRDRYSDKLLLRGIFPIDSCFFSSNAWRRIEPDLVVLMESELWPEHLYRAKERDVPVALINARLSDKSFNRYRNLRFFTEWVFQHVDMILAATTDDAARFREISIKSVKVRVTGNLKCDIGVEPRLDVAERTALRAEAGFSPDAFVLLGCSTWPGEEAMMLRVLDNLRRAHPALDARLLLVPRHMERRDEVETLAARSGFTFELRSRQRFPDRELEVYIADTTGELSRLIQIADLAFIGKTLKPNRGGQSPVEAAAIGLPMVFGPETSNFRYICRNLVAAGGARRVQDADEAVLALRDLALEPEMRSSLGKKALAWHASQRGASQRTVDHLMELVQLSRTKSC